ncbi:MAG: glutaredoxin family protein [Thermodesulfovibrio sp.]|nr:glutaredoxin family protein [Thermodesulfovibrio sp.]
MQPKVKMYTLSTCVHCKNAKKLLDDCKVSYEFEDVDLLTGKEREEVLEAIRKINANCNFPTILIGDRMIPGFREQEIREALGL